MADPLIISMLSDKRARLAGQVADLERQAAELRASIMHLLEQNDERAVQRARYMSLETIATLSDNPTVSLPAIAA